MRSTNYSRKKRGSRRSLRRVSRKSLRRKSLRGGRKSLRRKGRKSLRRGRKSLRRKSLRGGMDDDDINNVIMTNTKKKQQNVIPPPNIQCEVDPPPYNNNTLPEYSTLKADTGYGCDYHNKKKNKRICTKETTRIRDIDVFLNELKYYLTNLPEIYEDLDTKFTDVWGITTGVLSSMLKDYDNYININLYDNFLLGMKNELKVYGNIILDRSPPSYINGGANHNSQKASFAIANNQGGETHPDNDKWKTDEGKMEYVLHKIYNIINSSSQTKAIVVNKCNNKIIKIYLYSDYFIDTQENKFRIYLKYSTKHNGLIKIVIEHIDIEKENAKKKITVN